MEKPKPDECPEPESVDPDKMTEQMRSAVARIRAKLSHPEREPENDDGDREVGARS